MLRLVLCLLAISIVNGNLMARETDAGITPLTLYPAFQASHARIEAIIDKGLMQELVIRCSDVSGIVTFSKVEQVYCTPDHRCFGQLQTALKRLC